ncbi:MAG TPA: acetyl-CoA carboxylase biotin carboxyl carrier protein [Ignavibacteria bacterium]|nr:acetyl-CoA carboxylase biotin carboxyl carrier protein [Ignavibacteria bacterium]HMQ99708.1 acetyl-CoA carboxylase biotin carboxyl carrier protein [Ignavibacteria bacterium]
MKTDLNYIKKLLKILESGEINEIEIEEEGTRVRVVKSKPQEAVQAPQMITYAAPPMQQAPQAAAPVAASPTAPAVKTDEKKENISAGGKDLIEVRSPIVGTFYRAPSPNADPYVAVGQQVSKGNILCIIEAMKLMNEIECEYEGKITKILVENAQPVEYNQVLFLVEPN